MKLPIIQSKKGFTLIELLIVIAIISILISIGMAAFSRAQKQARDGQRKSDLQNVAGALEIYYADNNVYPAQAMQKIAVNGTTCNGTPDITLLWGSTFECSGKTYLGQLPKDPSSSQKYAYLSCPLAATGPQRYILWAKLDISTTLPAVPSNCPNLNSADSAWNYFVVPL